MKPKKPTKLEELKRKAEEFFNEYNKDKEGFLQKLQETKNTPKMVNPNPIQFESYSDNIFFSKEKREEMIKKYKENKK